MDESGKGDYFGPLVAAGVYAEPGMGPALKALGVRDSKRLSDGRVRELAALIRRRFPTEVVAINPERYNTLHATMGNLNRLLAWAHARVIENLLARVSCGRAIADQFGDETFLRRALMERGRNIVLLQQPRAEEAHPAVAAASVVARAEFLHRLEALGRALGMHLPKGAGPKVPMAGRELVASHGEGALKRAAKLHFRTTGQILGRPPAAPGA